jgi:predicted MFS family arabinose efflux permease
VNQFAARPKPRISRSEWGILLLLAAIQFTNILDFVIIMPIAPWAQVRYGITPAQFGHVVSAYGFASFVGSILAAKFLDRFGRKSALLALYLGFSISTLLCGLAPTYETLVAARALTGLFGGVVGAALMAIIGDVFADYRRGTAMGVVMSSFAVASIIGLPIGLLLVEFFGTGAPFIALAIASSIVWIGVFRVMPALPAHPEHRTSLWQLAIEPNHVIAYVFTITLVLGSFLVVPFLALAMVSNAGQRAEDMKYLYPIAGGFTLISTNIVGRISDRYGKRIVFRVMGSAAIVMAVVLTNLPPVPLWVAIAASTAFMVSTSGRMVPAQAMITASAAPKVRGGFLSLNAAVQSAAMGLASLLGGAIIGKADDGRLPGFPIVGVIAAVSALVSLILAGLLRSAETGPTRVASPEPVVVADAPSPS